MRALAVVVSVAGGAGLGFVIHQQGWMSQSTSSADAPTASVVLATEVAPVPPAAGPAALTGAGEVAPTTSSLASAQPSPTPTTDPTASAVPTDAAPAPAVTASAPSDPSECMRELFPVDTFRMGAPKLGFVCEQANPVKGALAVKGSLVRESGGAVTTGMKEWAVLGFHEMAAYAVLRGRCCAEPGMTPPAPPASCDLVGSLAEIARVSRPDVPEEEATAAIETYRKVMRCILTFKAGATYGGYGSVGGGEASTFKKVLERARRAK